MKLSSNLKSPMRFSNFRFLGVVAALAVMGGCVSVPKNPDPITAERAHQVALDVQLERALKRVQDQPRWSSSLDDRAAFASFNTNAVSVSFQGSAADILKAIAASRGLGFKITGPQPHIPIFVFVHSKDQPFEEFLRDLDKQFGQRASIVWTDTDFELRYR